MPLCAAGATPIGCSPSPQLFPVRSNRAPDYAQGEQEPAGPRAARREFPHDFYKAVADAGFLGIANPEEYGGSGLGISEAALVMRELAYAGAMNAASAVHLGIFGLAPVIRYGTEELKRRVLPHAVS